MPEKLTLNLHEKANRPYFPTIPAKFLYNFADYLIKFRSKLKMIAVELGYKEVFKKTRRILEKQRIIPINCKYGRC
jgi:hypothetical protein